MSFRAFLFSLRPHCCRFMQYKWSLIFLGLKKYVIVLALTPSPILKRIGVVNREFEKKQ